MIDPERLGDDELFQYLAWMDRDERLANVPEWQRATEELRRDGYMRFGSIRLRERELALRLKRVCAQWEENLRGKGDGQSDQFRKEAETIGSELTSLKRERESFMASVGWESGAAT